MPILPPFTLQDLIKGSTEHDSQYEEQDKKKEPLKCTKVDDGWVPIRSSAITSAYYKDNALKIRFPNGVVHEYSPISEELWLQFISSPSKGKFLSEHIKKNKDIHSKRIIQ